MRTKPIRYRTSGTVGRDGFVAYHGGSFDLASQAFDQIKGFTDRSVVEGWDGMNWETVMSINWGTR